MNAADTAWVLVSAALVMFMTPGLALFYGGMIRAKSVLNTMALTAACLGVIAVVWVAFGFSLAFGPDHAGGSIGDFGQPGLYLNPPRNAVVFSVDEKPQIQALQRAAPMLPDVHVICDNLSTHKVPAVRRWLLAHPRFVLHFTPTYSSWINQVERWFAEIQRRCLDRGVFCSLEELTIALQEWIKLRNDSARPVSGFIRSLDIRSRWPDCHCSDCGPPGNRSGG